MSNMAHDVSLNLLGSELLDELKQIEVELERFSDNPMDKYPLENCPDKVRNAIGVLKILELDVLVSLLELAQSGVTKLIQDRFEQPVEATALIGRHIIIIQRYLEYLMYGGQHLPEFLVNSYNELAELLEKPAISQSFFVEINANVVRPVPNAYGALSQPEKLVGRLRLVFQVGLLGLLKKEDAFANLKIMSLAVNRMERFCGDAAVGTLFWTMKTLLSQLADDTNLQYFLDQKLLIKVEKIIHAIAKSPQSVCRMDSSLPLIKEWVYLIGLKSQDSADAKALCEAFGYEPSTPLEVLLKQKIAFDGPTGSVMKEVVQNLKFELSDIKKTLDQIATGSYQVDPKEFSEKVRQFGNTLLMLEQNEQSEVLGQWATKFAKLSEEELMGNEALLSEVVEDLLGVENAIVKISKESLGAASIEVNNPNVSQEHFEQGHLVVLEESRTTLSKIKNLINACLSGVGNQAELSSVIPELDDAIGGLEFIELNKAKELLMESKQFLISHFIEVDEMPMEEDLEGFADALSSLDYYLQSILDGRPIGDAILDVVKLSMLEAA